MNYIKGNLVSLSLQNQFDIIIHGCNCFHKFGKGIAKSIREVYPKAYDVDLETRKGDQAKLGTYSFCTYPNVTIINAYTQYRYDHTLPMVDYDAIDKVFQLLSQQIDEDRRIGIPQIGAGLAGGQWSKIESIIEKYMNAHNLTCVMYDGT